MVAGQAYATFQEMHQRVVKIVKVIDEIEADNREVGQAKKKFGTNGSISQVIVCRDIIVPCDVQPCSQVR